jgi:HPt (histidine-containing phosphotransfer) domain-containing protein
MDDFIAKPVDPERMLATVSRWLGAEVRSAGPSAEPQQVASDWQAALARIEGMDIAAALRSVRGRWATLERLLRGFLRDHADDGPSLLRELAARQFELVERRAHTLKGLAGTLGIRPLAAGAAQLEALLRARPEDPEPARQLAESVAAQMGQLLDQLRAALPPPQDAPRELVDMNALRGVVETLERLLADDDARALDLLDRHGALLARGFGAQAATLERLVRHFEFDAARERVLAALAHWPPVADGP